MIYYLIVYLLLGLWGLIGMTFFISIPTRVVITYNWKQKILYRIVSGPLVNIFILGELVANASFKVGSVLYTTFINILK